MKYKRMIVSAELFLSLFTEGVHPGLDRSYAVIADPVPLDAKLVHVRHAWPNSIELLIASESFPTLRKGEEIPLLQPTISNRP